MVLCYLSCLSSSCVWLCPTHIVLCYLSCLSSSCVLWMVVSNTYSVVLFVLFIVVLCMVVSNTYSVQPSTRHRKTRNKTNNTTLYVLDTTMHKTETTTNKTNNPTHIVLCYLSCLSLSCVLCKVVSNTYSVVLFVLFVVVLCLVYGCVQHI
jgi:Flp pilus assembly protein protease CpaA